jgi:hypothetical protein
MKPNFDQLMTYDKHNGRTPKKMEIRYPEYLPGHAYDDESPLAILIEKLLNEQNEKEKV